jgi:regulator of replication initiation timing
MVQLTPDECKRMIEHMEQCHDCHDTPEKFSFFLQPLAADAAGQTPGVLLGHLEKGGLRERFIERARAEGIPFSSELLKRRDDKSWKPHLFMSPLQWGAAAAILALIVALTGYRAARPWPRRSLEAGTPSRAKRAVTPQTQSSPGLEAKVAELQATIANSQQTISELRGENAFMLRRMGALEKDLGASQAQYQALEQSRARLIDANTQLAAQNDNNARLLAESRATIEELRAHGAEIDAKVAAEKAEVGTLLQQLKLQTATVDHERELLAAGRDVTDLMGARNLHVIDVHDADGKGKNKNSFGRIFYTEGRSLIFYAYDLDERKMSNTNYTFKVWGERLGKPSSVRSLGILYTDDREQKRWAMKVDDPQQLAEIDSLFVTLEPHEGDQKPLGQKILFAFLGGKANHF